MDLLRGRDHATGSQTKVAGPQRVLWADGRWEAQMLESPGLPGPKSSQSQAGTAQETMRQVSM